MLKRVTVSALVFMLIFNQLIPASAAMAQMAEEIISQEWNEEAKDTETEKITRATPSNGEKSEISKIAKATSSNAYQYQFEDNMLVNSDFNEGKKIGPFREAEYQEVAIQTRRAQAVTIFIWTAAAR